jgi:hypothetical protein
MNFNINRNVHLISVITIGASDGTDGRRLCVQSKCSVYSQVILPCVLLEKVFFILYLNFVLYKYHFIAI